MAPRRRKRRKAELRNSLRLGVVLAGLVGINVYVFFFNRGTAPRDVLNLQSTSKTMESTRHELLAKDASRGHALLASAAPVPAKMPSAPAKAPAMPAAAAPVLVAAPAAPAAAPSAKAEPPAAPPVFQVPANAAPAPESASAPAAAAPQVVAVAASPAHAPAHAPYQVPWAPPPEDDGESAVGGDGAIERRFANNVTLGAVLSREGFGPSAPSVVAALSKLVDPKTIQGGQKYFVRLDESGAPESFEYQPSAALRYIVERQDSGAWTAHKAEQPVESKIIEAGGVVESSLYESVQKAGESTSLVSLLVELFAWDVNFYTDQHPGDHWKVVVEKQLLGGKFYKYGKLLAAEYGGKVGTFRAFYFAGRSGKQPGHYYDERGQAISKTMLKTPLRFVRISSKFDRKRFHPILHVEKAHLGIDYAAPVGTPVWASASGRVVEVGMKRGSGNTIVIAHSNGIATRYYHLSRYARGLHVGQMVKQKDVIGFVGTTGLSTGPHLHFSVTKNGAFVDPNKMQINRDAPVADRAGFLDAIRPRLAALRNIQPGAVARN
ncbi:MAG TPA: peptidoglycan DD-metalloendopeptidase family protein [Polyangia bacterium]|nr:peptidoglycan DD-metalloendopeptidase family protein [Polyangia bacterium]